MLKTLLKNLSEIEKNGNIILQYVRAIRKFPWRFWVIVLSDMCMQGAIWPFVAFSPDFFYRHYGNVFTTLFSTT